MKLKHKTCRQKLLTAVLSVLMLLYLLPSGAFAASPAAVSGYLSKLRVANTANASTAVEYAMSPAFSGTTKGYTISVPDYYTAGYVWATLSEDAPAGSTIQASWTHATTNAAKTVKVTSGKATGQSLLGYVVGGTKTNTLTLTVGTATDYQTYTVDIVRTPTLSDLSVANIAVKETFSAMKTEYTATTNLDKAVIQATPASSDYTVTYNGSTSNEVALTSGENPISICVSYGSQSSKTYQLTITKVNTAAMTFETVPTDALVMMQDPFGGTVLADDSGSFSLMDGLEYSYTVTKNGYIAQTGTVTAGSVSSKQITLTEAPENNKINASVSSEWSDFRGKNNLGITNAKTPYTPEDTELLWAVKFGDSWSDAPGSPILADGSMIVYVDTNLKKLDLNTGAVLKEAAMVTSSSYAITPPVYGEGMIFVGLGGGKIQAFNAQTLESLWLYTDPLGGQPNGQIVYDNGYIYAGFWNAETKNANFVCISVTDENPDEQQEAKSASWRYARKGGFYWAGAYVSDRYVIIGTDDGVADSVTESASLLVFNKKTGKLVDSWDGIRGDIRSSVSYDPTSDRIFFTSKGGVLCNAKINWTTGEITDKKSRTIVNSKNLEYAMSTCTPSVYNGRIYIGVSGSSGFGLDNGHCIAVYDLAQDGTMTQAYTYPIKGNPQTSALLTTAYSGEDDYVYIYLPYNASPGGISVLKDKPGQTAPLTTTDQGYSEIFTPQDPLAQYSIASPIADSYGTIYYKNDSRYMMALTPRIEKIEIKQQPTDITDNGDGTYTAAGMKVAAKLVNQMERDITNYVTIEDREGTKTVVYTYGLNAGSYTTKELTVALSDDENGADPDPAAGYTVSVGSGSTISMDEDATVKLTVGNTNETTYNAYHLTVSYDAEKLTYKSINTDASVKNANGILTITGYGADKACASDQLILTFTGKAAGSAEVTVTKAYIDKSANANVQDAPEAEITAAKETIVVGGYAVDLDSDFEGNGTAAAGSDYTFTAKDKHYDYTFDATMGDAPADVVDNQDGTYTIRNVSGSLKIEVASKTAKTYTVEVSGTGSADVTAASTAVYQTAYTFTLNKNEAYDYVLSVTVDDEAYTPTLGTDGKTYTIAGADVTGDIAITVSKTLKPVTTTAISFTGTGSADVVGGTNQTADNGVDFKFKLNEAEGFDYTVTFESAVLPADEQGYYTIPGAKITGTALTVTVEKTAQSGLHVTVTQYIKLNEKTMWLVSANGTVSADKILAYDGSAMFWSEKYEAYCFLIVSADDAATVKEAAEEKIAEASAAKTSIAYDGDVNETGIVDINDAQLIYDMYNASYESITETVSMIKFLEADVNGDKTVSTLDAAAVVEKIQG